MAHEMSARGIGLVNRKIDLQRIALLLLVVIAALLRFFDLDRTGIWIDEAFSWFQSNRSFVDMIFETSSDNYPPLHNIILNFTIRFFGDSETTMRVPSALLGTLAVFLTYRVGTALWDKTTGLLACLLMTFCGSHIWYSQEIRMYALLSCTAVYFVLTVIHATRDPSRKHLAINALAGVLLLFSHIFGSFIFLGINLFVMVSLVQQRAWVRVNWKDWIIAQSMAATVYIPWALLIILVHATRIREEGFWIPELSAKYIFENLSYVAGGAPTLVTFFALGLVAILSLNSVRLAHFFQKRKLIFPLRFSSVFEVDWRLGLVLTWFFSPLFFGFVASAIINQNILNSRYLSGSTPAFLLLAAVGIRKLQFSRPLQLIALSLAIATSLPAAHYALRIKERSNPKAMISSIQAQFRTGDQVFVYEPWMVHLFEYYLQGTEISSHIIPGPESIEQWTPHSNRFWILTVDLRESETRELLKRAAQTHELAFSVLYTESQAYLFFRKTKG